MMMNKELQKTLTPTKADIEKFSSKIESLMFQKNMNPIEAIIHYCEENNMDFIVVSKLISKDLKQKLEITAKNLKLLKLEK